MRPTEAAMQSVTGVRAHELEADCSSPSGAEVKNAVLYLHSTVHLFGMVLNTAVIIPFLKVLC
jgi:hypothetical protein